MSADPVRLRLVTESVEVPREVAKVLLQDADDPNLTTTFDQGVNLRGEGDFETTVYVKVPYRWERV